MHQQLDQRFTDLVHEREETRADRDHGGRRVGGRPRTIVHPQPGGARLLGYGPDDPFPALAELFHEKAARDLVATVLSGDEAEPQELERVGPRCSSPARAAERGRAAS